MDQIYRTDNRFISAASGTFLVNSGTSPTVLDFKGIYFDQDSEISELLLEGLVPDQRNNFATDGSAVIKKGTIIRCQDGDHFTSVTRSSGEFTLILR